MRGLDYALELGRRRFLIELPTGTGKTDLICLYLKRLLQAGWAERILFLVDRDQLAKQALEAIQDILGSYSSYWLRAGMARQEQQITVALLQTMISRVDEYTAGYFDIVIADECHRSIYGAWQGALTRFDAIHIGLTATPANYIERNTYDFYQCEPGKPTSPIRSRRHSATDTSCPTASPRASRRSSPRGPTSTTSTTTPSSSSVSGPTKRPTV